MKLSCTPRECWLSLPTPGAVTAACGRYTHNFVERTSTQGKVLPPCAPASTGRDATAAEAEPKGLRGLHGDHGSSPSWGQGERGFGHC